LNGLDKVWSDPTESSLKEYKYLPYGKYTLMVEVMTKSGQKLSQTSYSFEVAPPFYWSTTAIILYFLLFLGLIYGSSVYNRYLFQVKKDKIRIEEEDWAIFETNFDRIHENFFRILHLKYPVLTSNDLRLCAYLCLNLSSKDMAHLLNISLKGVEVGRYRIRKKIGLPSTKSLSEFMIEFK